jgi:type II secretory pathway pseudopilin PulG
MSSGPPFRLRWGAFGQPPALPVRVAGFTLVEVLASLGLVASIGVIASGAALAMIDLTRAAHAEAVGLAAAEQQLEALVGTDASSRRSGNDTVVVDRVSLTRIWRVSNGDPAPGVDRLEVTVHWSAPSLTQLTLATVAP